MIFVTGATGNLGGGVVSHLLEMLDGPEGIAVGTRNVDSPAARSLADKGLDVRHLDFLEPESIPKALEGATKVLMISTYDPNRMRIVQHRNAISGAVSAGVEHLVYTSFINAVPESLFLHNTEVHVPSEAAIIDSGMTYTILRHGLYLEYLLTDLKDTLASGELKRGGGSTGISFVSRDDLALSAATILVKDGHENRIYTETGPEALSMAQAAAILSEVFGRKIEHVDKSPEEWLEISKSLGFEESLSIASASGVEEIRAGGMGEVTQDYKKITGRDPRSLRQAMLDNKDVYLRLFG